MTGATGTLTPEGTDEPFVPAERREISDASASGAGTVSMRRRSDEAPAGRGLAADDPAYRVETDSRHAERESQPAEGDERSDREERF